MTVRLTPKRQAYPASLIKAGAVLYSVLAYTDDDGKTSTEYQEWVVRSIKAKRGTKSRYGHTFSQTMQGDTRKYVNLSQKVQDVTWVKRKGKTGWATSIPSYLKRQFEVGDELPRGIYTTQRAALVYAIRSHQEGHQRYDKWLAEETDPDELAQLRADKTTHEAEMRALATRFTKAFGKRTPAP